MKRQEQPTATTEEQNPCREPRQQPIPSTGGTFALLFQLTLLFRNSSPRSHSGLSSPLPTTVHAFNFFPGRLAWK